jgi:hypothetical protein
MKSEDDDSGDVVDQRLEGNLATNVNTKQMSTTTSVAGQWLQGMVRDAEAFGKAPTITRDNKVYVLFVDGSAAIVPKPKDVKGGGDLL